MSVWDSPVNPVRSPEPPEAVPSQREEGLRPPAAPDGRERLSTVAQLFDFKPDLLLGLYERTIAMAREGQLETDFIFFAVHRDNVYSQPTDVRDFDQCWSTVHHHTARADYRVHGTVLKSPVVGLDFPSAVVMHVYSREGIVAAVAADPVDNYNRLLTVY